VAEPIVLLTGMVIAALAGAPTVALLKRLGCVQHISEWAPERHRAKAGTPTCGGLLLVAAAACAFLLTGRYFRTVDISVVGVLIFMVLGAALGFADDLLSLKRGRNLGLKARHKLLGQVVLTGWFLYYQRIIGSGGMSVVLPFSGRVVPLGWPYWPAVGLLVIFFMNAVNLSDGLDGLAAGLSVPALLALGLAGLRYHQGSAPLLCFAVAGACLGFLWINAYPARAFMGDTGSLALGCAMAGAAVAMRQEILLLAVGAVFVVEALSVVAQVMSFKLTGRRILRMTPLHHHFELGGWSENTVVTRFWLVGAALAAAAVVGERCWAI
jgi:phospho-N-acetylmuramoyl-pentapeptide-transferase